MRDKISYQILLDYMMDETDDVMHFKAVSFLTRFGP